MKVWYVSKYGYTPSSGNPTRQFMLSKSFAKLGAETTFILSRSNGSNQRWFWGLKRVENVNDVHCVILNGPVISLGFSAKRIFSWLLFEWHLWLYCMTIKKEEQPDIIIASSMSLLPSTKDSIIV